LLPLFAEVVVDCVFVASTSIDEDDDITLVDVVISKSDGAEASPGVFSVGAMFCGVGVGTCTGVVDGVVVATDPAEFSAPGVPPG
jgi:hypothetical protein